jgi:iron complex transport system substrate-binding protein
MKFQYRVFTVIIFITLLLTACSPAALSPAPSTGPTPGPSAQPTSPAISLKDGLDRQVTLPSPAKKIISLSASNTEILFALGAGTQVIGRDEFSDYPVEVKTLPSVGGSFGKYNLEEITRLQPDLIIAAAINNPQQVKSLEDLKLNVYYLPNPTTLDGLYANFKTVATLTGRQKEADSLIANMQQRVLAVQNKISKATGKPKVFYELDGSEPGKPWTTGSGTFVDLLIQIAGGENVGSVIKGDWAQISQEQLIVSNPDIILLGDAAYGTTPQQVSNRAGWNVIKAVKDNKISPVNDIIITRPGPRVVEALEELARLIHPELFQ